MPSVNPSKRVFGRLVPSDEVTPEAYQKSLSWMVRNGVAAQIMDTLSVGTLLTAFALQFGASNLYIGLLAAIPHFAGLGQLGGVYLVEKHRNRRAICVGMGIFSRLALLALPVAVMMPETELALFIVLLGVALRYGIGAIIACSWNSWLRDLIPDRERGSVLSRRTMIMTAMGMVLGLGSAGFIDLWKAHELAPEKYAYAVLFLCAFAGGVYGIFTLTKIEEPRMARTEGQATLLERLSLPFRDENFRRLMGFLAAWSFAANLAAPFFTVHMLTRLNLDLFPVMVFATLSQLANILVLRKFGRIADRMSNKAVLAVCAPLFILCIFAWVFTTASTKLWIVLPLLAAIHIFTGIASAGVNVATTSIAMKLAPAENATAYLAANSLVSSFATGLAPMIGGLLADFFADQKLSVLLRWETGVREVALETVRIEHWDFYFVMEAVIGLYSLHRLAFVKEEGEIDERAVLREVLSDVRQTIQNISSVAGLRAATDFPFHLLTRFTRRQEHHLDEK